MQSKKTTKLIIANSILLVFLAIGFVYAWFATNYGNVVDGDQVEVIADSALEISFTGQDGSWKSYLNLSNSDSGVNFETLEFKDITGSGDGNFLRPALSQFGGYAQVDSDSAWSPTIENQDYLKFDLYMRSTDKLNVFLGDGSSVTPLAEKLTGTYTTQEAETNRKSSYGNFSKDLVAGAVRVSAVNSSTNHLFSWIPCPNIYLKAGPSEAIDAYDIITNAVSSGTFEKGYSPYEHWYYSSAQSTDPVMLSEEKTVTGSIETANDKTKLVTLDTLNGSFYQDKVTIYIWLEGCDNEARRAFVGGKFKVSLSLSSQDVG